MKKVTLQTLQEYKQKNQKFSCLTAYDACFSHFISTAEIDVILVGDSLGMVLQGKDSTVPVTLKEMIYHTRCVKRGANGPLIMSDLPFMTYTNEDQAISNSARLMQAGATVVKLEGGAWSTHIVEKMSSRGIPVCVHLGLTPQTVDKLSGYRVQGKQEQHAATILQDAIDSEQAGAELLLLECVPSNLTQRIQSALKIPVIGIGAGPHTDAQVLVLHDMLGLNAHKPAKFVKDFMAHSSNGIPGALTAYHEAVTSGSYPGPEHTFE